MKDITDFLSHKLVSEFRSKFKDFAGVYMNIMDISGNPVIDTCKYSPICTVIRETRTGLARCKKEEEKIVSLVKKHERSIMIRCFAGFTKYAVPLMFKNKLLGFITGGGMVFEDTRETVAKNIVCLANELTLDREKLLGMLNGMNVYPSSKKESLTSLVEHLAEAIVALGYWKLGFADYIRFARKAVVKKHIVQLKDDYDTRAKIVYLYKVMHMIEAEKDPMRKYYFFLTFLTAKDGWAFNRAMLFSIVDKKGKKEIVGSMAIGPVSGEEAETIWRELSAKNMDLQELMNRDYEVVKYTSLNKEVCKIKVKEPESISFIHTYLSELKPVIIPNALSVSSIPQQIRKLLLVENVVVLPLVIGDNQLMGFVLLDNPFSIGQFDEEDIYLLSLFANNVAVSIRNAMLFKQLELNMLELNKVRREIWHYHEISLRQRFLGSLGKLAAGFAHEIRNILHVITINMHLLEGALEEKKIALDEERSVFEGIRDEIERLNNLVGDFLQYGSPKPVKFELFNLHELIDDILKLDSNIASMHKIKVVKSYSSDINRIIADKEQLRRAINNLILNAIQAMEEEGTLFITTRLEKTHLNEHLPTPFMDRVIIEVADTGPGIPDTEKSQVFEPFFTTKAEGTGLGLSIVKRVINSHDGNVTIANRPGGGTIVRIDLPKFEH